MAACGSCGGGSMRRWTAINPVTGDCLVTNPDGSCRRFKTRQGAIKAAEATGAENPGAMLV